jgi:Peptidase family M28
MNRPRPVIASAALWLGVLLIGGLGIYGTRPPASVAASAPANVFSAARAMAHLAEIAKNPHPLGSDDANRVREYLLGQLRELGGEVHVEEGIGAIESGRSHSAGRVHNIVATFPGQNNSRAIMVVAHYDSVPEGPGAADDGAGLIAILEAVRAVRAMPPIKNDLVVLFTDGEEPGVLGAQAFTASHAGLADRVGLMVNLEARGSSGPGLMFETSNDNGALIREFARAAPSPMATSLMAAVYKLLPNDTDFTPLTAAGLTGLNFAFLETYQSYHTRLDTPANLDPRSVQHVGANVLGVIRHFGNLPLPLTRERDLVYFNWFGTVLWVYPIWLAWAVGVLAPIVFALGCIRFAGRAGLTVRGTLAGFVSFFVQLAIMVGGSFAGFLVARYFAGELLEGDTVSNQLLFAGIMGIAVGLGITGQRLFANRIGLANLGAGQLFAVSLLTLALCWFLVGGSYVLQWPVVFGMAGTLLGVRFAEPARRVLCAFIFLIPALLILVPLACMFFVSLLLTYLGLAAVGLILTVLLAMAPPIFHLLAGRSRVAIASIVVVSALLIGAGIRLSVWSAGHPRRDSLIYSVNADQNNAKWVSYDTAPDNWTRPILGAAARKQSDPAYTAGLERPLFMSDATLVPLTPPSVAITQNSIRDGQQTVTLQIASSRGARALILRLPSDLELTAAGWNGNVEPISDKSPGGGPSTFRFFNAPPAGVSFEFRFRGQHPVAAWVGDTTPGLPEIAPLIPRPADTTAGYASDITLVAKRVDL